MVTLDDGTKVCTSSRLGVRSGSTRRSGWRRKQWKVESPEGPTSSDRLQGALNATAVDADLLVIGMICLESASKGFAEKQGIDEIGRTVAEWHFSKQEFGPWAKSGDRPADQHQEWLEAGVVPERRGGRGRDGGQSSSTRTRSVRTGNVTYCTSLGYM